MGEADTQTRLIALLVFVVLVAIIAIVTVTLLAGAWRRRMLRERLWEAERQRKAAREADLQDTWAAAAQRLKAEAGDDVEDVDDDDDDDDEADPDPPR